MNIIWTEGALSDWSVIAQYIGVHFGKKAFEDFENATDEAEHQIQVYPESGTIQTTRKHSQLKLRFVLINKLSKMIYHVDDDAIFIDVIWDTRQSPKRLEKRLGL
jgi:plasmid stabilization system protein ParE